MDGAFEFDMNPTDPKLTFARKLCIEQRTMDGTSCTTEIDIIGNASGMLLLQSIIAISICLLNTLSEFAVVYLLSVLRKNRGNSIGIVLSLTLCTAEVFISVLSLVTILFSLASTENPVALGFLDYIIIIIAMLFTPVLYVVKLFIAYNEVMKVYLNASYDVFFTKKRSKVIILFVWTCGAFFFVCTTIAYEVFAIHPNDIYKIAIIPGAVAFVISACFSNGFLLVKLNRSRLTPHLQSYTSQPFLRIFFRSQFVLPILISFVFILFLTSAAVESYIDRTTRSSMNFITFLIFNVMILIDMLIYLFLEPQIRTLLRNRLRNWRDRRLVANEIDRSREGISNVENTSSASQQTVRGVDNEIDVSSIQDEQLGKEEEQGEPRQEIQEQQQKQQQQLHDQQHEQQQQQQPLEQQHIQKEEMATESQERDEQNKDLSQDHQTSLEMHEIRQIDTID